MATTHSPRIASYEGVTSIIDPVTRTLKTHNEQGEIFPHATEAFSKLSPQEQARQIPAHFYPELQQYAQEHVQRMGHLLPHASPLTQPSSGPAAKAHEVATTILAPTSTHQFVFKGLKVSFQAAFGTRNAKGVSHSIKVAPSSWKKIEALSSKYLEQFEEITSKNTSAICRIGFTQHTDDEEIIHTHFVAYVITRGVFERFEIPIDPDHLEKVNEFFRIYPDIQLPEHRPLSQRSLKIQGEALEEGLALSNIRQALKYESETLNPIVKSIYEKALSIAKKTAKDHAVHYSYVAQHPPSEEEFNAILPYLIEPTNPEFTHISDRMKKLKNNEARIYYSIPPRAGTKEDHLDNETLLSLAEEQPLPFAVNASLGSLDKNHAPQTSHFENVVIQTKTGRFFPTINTVAIVQNKIAEFKFSGASNKYEVLAELNRLFCISIRRYQKIQEMLSDSKEIIIHEPLASEYLGTADLNVHFFIPLFTQLLLNNQQEQMPKIKVHFEYPEADPMVKVHSRIHFEKVCQFFTDTVNHGLSWDPQDILTTLLKNFIGEFILPQTLEGTSFEDSESDRSSISTNSDEYFSS